VETVLELRADEPLLRVSTAFVNPARDHRLRVHLPLPEPATHSVAGCAFGTVRRALTTEGRPDEYGLPTFPARGFVQAGGLTVLTDAVTEYELVDVTGDGDTGRAGTLALTVLRATGMLSRLGMTYRPFPAGPLTPVEGLQLVGRKIHIAYALAVGDVDPWALADDLTLPLEVTASLGGGTRPASGSALEVTGAEVSAVRRQAGLLEVRVFNPTDTPATVGFGARTGWQVDLRGRPVAPFDGSFVLRPHGIATVVLPGA
jgi:alpha-mannosidase